MKETWQLINAKSHHKLQICTLLAFWHQTEIPTVIARPLLLRTFRWTFSHDRPAKNLVGEELTCRIEKHVSLFIYMPVECSYYHSVSGLVPRQVVTVLSFYFRAELLIVRLAGLFSSILLAIFFSLRLTFSVHLARMRC